MIRALYGWIMSARNHDRPMLALLIRLGGMAGLATMAALIKLASQRGIHLAEIIFWRQATSLPILLVWAVTTGGLYKLRPNRPKAHAIRGIYGLVGMVCNFLAVILLPLAEATTFSFSAPIFAVFLSMLLLHEKIGIWRWSAVAAGFVGILIIAQPGGGHVAMEGAAIALGGAFMVALISIQIRDLSKTDNPMVIVFWFAMTSTVCSLPFMFFVAKAHPPGDWLLLLGIGLSGTWGQLLITAALRYGNVASVIVMDYSSIGWATLYGWLLFATLPSTSTWLGAPLIVAAGLIITWRERVVSKRRFADQRLAGGT